LVSERDAQLYNTEVGLFGSRSGGGKRSLVARGGGSTETESSVDTGLKWLARQQMADGSWDTAATGGAKSEQQDATALALLSFLGAGHTESVGMHKECVQKAVAWLKARQQTDGFIGDVTAPGDGELAKFRKAGSHALVTMALCEAAGMGKAPETMKSAQQGLTWLAAQHPFRGLEQRLSDAQGLTDDDILAVFWCVGAAKSGKIACLDVPLSLMNEALTFFDRCEVRGDAESRHRYRFFDKERKVPGCLDTACALLCRQFLGYKREELLPGVAWLGQQPNALPDWGADGNAFDWRYVYLTNLVLFQTGGDAWRRWNDVLKSAMASEQARDQTDKGAWSASGTLKGRSRVLSTAFGSLFLEVYYRYLPMYR
jgi:hypothetical protein